MDNTASIAINRESIDKIKTVCGRENTNFEILDFSTISTGEDQPVKEVKEVKEPKEPKAD